MNIDDIKKGLECCSNPRLSSCNNCPYNNNGEFSCRDGEMCKDALNLITEQEKEIERLKAENEELTKVVSSKVYDLIDNTKEIADARETWEQQAKIDVLNELRAHLYVVYGTNTADLYYVYGTNRLPLGNKTAEDIVKNIDELIKEYEE